MSTIQFDSIETVSNIEENSIQLIEYNIPSLIKLLGSPLMSTIFNTCICSRWFWVVLFLWKVEKDTVVEEDAIQYLKEKLVVITI